MSLTTSKYSWQFNSSSHELVQIGARTLLERVLDRTRKESIRALGLTPLAQVLFCSRVLFWGGLLFCLGFNMIRLPIEDLRNDKYTSPYYTLSGNSGYNGTFLGGHHSWHIFLQDPFSISQVILILWHVYSFILFGCAAKINVT